MKADFGWDDTERKENYRKEKAKGKKKMGKEHGKERERQGKSRRAYGCRKILGNVFSRPIPLCFRQFWPAWRPPDLLVFERKEEVELEWRKMNGVVGMLQEERAVSLAEELAGAEEWGHFIIFQHPRWPGRGPVRLSKTESREAKVLKVIGFAERK